ncbi:hypothetical protein IAI53_07245 [Thauera sp. CAU 1555]|uniref:Uncharacterized protein n=1 Tax=Thauera sedimentorum TaxID=2767595 RepID=A0ABR9B8J2_9RHOO|nr:hypothetical protein [Thauera sedimentorum]MBC9071759.1 hypothetical protein [Thauera sedimentorum]MBD8502678.1 hypothetical protein [Thauera sedimentorum]
MLRAGGENFNVDGFIASVPLPIDSLWRKGERRFPNSTKNEKINETSGIRIVASEASFSQFQRQIEDVISFLQANLENVKRLSSFPGVEWLALDFGAEIYPPGWSSFTFPPELLFLSGQAGVSLCLSVYPTENEVEADA